MHTKINNLEEFYKVKENLGNALHSEVGKKLKSIEGTVKFEKDMATSVNFEGENTTTPVQSSKGNNHTDLPKGSKYSTNSKNP